MKPMPATPEFCDPKAFATFCDQLPLVESTTGLVNAATAIAMHAFPETDLEDVHARIDELARRIHSRARSRSPQALLAHLHDVLFDEEEFAGAPELAYYDPSNSFFPLALQTRRGLPITLSLIYKAVANQLGLKTCGVNAPFHFLVRVRSEKGWLLIDPFDGGRMLHRDEAIARIEAIAGRNRLREDQFLPPATHREWLRRMLDNLCSTLERRGHTWDLMAMRELMQALDESLALQYA
jgi:regulator of sirC expression with transglutaminase-like and TPR domain